MFPPVARRGSPSVTKRTSGVLEDDLDRVGRVVEERVRVGGTLEPYAMRDEVDQAELAQEVGRVPEPARPVPARRERRVDAADLRALDRESPAVEAASEVERDALLAVPGAHDDGAFV